MPAAPCGQLGQPSGRSTLRFPAQSPPDVSARLDAEPCGSRVQSAGNGFGELPSRTLVTKAGGGTVCVRANRRSAEHRSAWGKTSSKNLPSHARRSKLYHYPKAGSWPRHHWPAFLGSAVVTDPAAARSGPFTLLCRCALRLTSAGGSSPLRTAEQGHGERRGFAEVPLRADLLARRIGRLLGARRVIDLETEVGQLA